MNTNDLLNIFENNRLPAIDKLRESFNKLPVSYIQQIESENGISLNSVFDAMRNAPMTYSGIFPDRFLDTKYNNDCSVSGSLSVHCRNLYYGGPIDPDSAYGCLTYHFQFNFFGYAKSAMILIEDCGRVKVDNGLRGYSTEETLKVKLTKVDDKIRGFQSQIDALNIERKELQKMLSLWDDC